MDQIVLGGKSDAFEADERIQQICDKIRPLVEVKLSTVFPEFTAITQTSQTVRGYKRCVKVHVGDEDYLHVNVYEKPSRALELTGVDVCMSRDSPL